MKSSGEKISIMYLLQGLQVGGLEKMVVLLARSLNRSLFSPCLCCYDSLGPLEKDCREEGIEVILMKRREGIDWRYPFRLAALVRKKRIKILHPHNSTALFYGVLGGWMGKVPGVLYTEHDRVFPERWRLRVLNWFLSHGTHKVIAVSHQLREALIRYERFSPSKIEVIWNGVEQPASSVDEEGLAFRNALNLDPSAPVVGILGRLTRVKNHRLLFESFLDVVRELPQARLLVVGDGFERKNLEALSREMGLAGAVLFLGEQKELDGVIGAMDVLVLSSLSEGLPLALLEGMARGRAVLSTRVGGVEEVIRDEENGLLISPGDREALSRAMLRLLQDPETRRRLAAKGRETCEKHFSLEAMVSAYERTYLSVLKL